MLVKISRKKKRRVTITFQLSERQLSFSRWWRIYIKGFISLGAPHINQSYNYEDGNTGKFGTGFVTTHVLNMKVVVSGLLQNKLGVRQFSISLDRTPDTLEGFQSELNRVFERLFILRENTPNIETMLLTRYE